MYMYLGKVAKKLQDPEWSIYSLFSLTSNYFYWNKMCFLGPKTLWELREKIPDFRFLNSILSKFGLFFFFPMKRIFQTRTRIQLLLSFLTNKQLIALKQTKFYGVLAFQNIFDVHCSTPGCPATSWATSTGARKSAKFTFFHVLPWKGTWQNVKKLVALFKVFFCKQINQIMIPTYNVCQFLCFGTWSLEFFPSTPTEF